MMFPLVGNEGVKNAVVNAIGCRRIPHAIMIEGDEGMGRHSLARFIATAAVCEGQTRPCGTCRGCHLAEVGSHPDISVVSAEEGKKNITVDKIRSLRAEAFIKAHSANHRVFIIDGAHSMNDQAQNALLKVLEEPPQGVIFILLVLSRTSMLDTIVSRCTVLSLSAVESSLAKEYLSKSTEFSAEDIASAVQSSSGNIGEALRILGKKQDSAARAAAKQFLDLLFDGRAADMLKLLHPMEKDRVGADEFFSALRSAIIAEMRRSRGNDTRLRVLDSLFEDTKKYTQLLKTNINLPLLFSAAVCSAKQLTER